MIKMMRAAVATTFAVAAAAVLAGCPAGGITGVTTPVPTGAAGQTCDQTAPAGNPSTGTSVHGAYNGQKLPDGWATQLKTEAEVTNAIKGIEAGNQTTWACWQGFYPGALSIYKAKK